MHSGGSRRTSPLNGLDTFSIEAHESYGVKKSAPQCVYVQCIVKIFNYSSSRDNSQSGLALVNGVVFNTGWHLFFYRILTFRVDHHQMAPKLG